MSEGKKGFSGLSSLVSKVDETAVEQARRSDQSEEPPDSHRQGTEIHPASPKADAKAPLGQSGQEVVGSGTSRTSRSSASGVRWVLGFAIGIGVLFWLLNVAQEDNGRSGTAPSSTPPASSPRDTPSAASVAETYELEFIRLPVGDQNVLLVAQIRWCIREEIGIEVLRPLPMSHVQIKKFSDVVTHYNSRCGSYRYRQGTLRRAQREVERVRTQIVSSVQPPRQASVSPSEGGLDWSGLAPTTRPFPQWSRLTLDVQNALTALGYEPGPADGLYGAKTKSAIESFQRDTGTTATDGRVTQTLLQRLSQEEASRQSRGSTATPTAATPTAFSTHRLGRDDAYFTRNSHDDDVLRLQGTPSDIDRYDASGYEIWRFGGSTLKIDSQTRRVLEWDNNGNLKVKLLPGSRATSSSQFTRGSHEDDVLRLQGTPSDIDRYEASGYEIWRFGSSTVEIDARTRQVMEWDNNGNLKVHLAPGNQTTASPRFTLGSHEDDVLRLQGTPSDIDRYDASGYEIWRFGSSTVKIDAGTRQVMEWDNNGSLKVHLAPGDQTTASPRFTLGSHEDDVLRLQGTPSDIDRYDASGYEIWRFGSSTVKVDARTRGVVEWDNHGNLKVRLLPGSKTTSSRSFSKGSHQDDVLRLQGTPTNIKRYDASGYDVWNFGLSTVKIDSRSRLVLEWVNNGNLKARS